MPPWSLTHGPGYDWRAEPPVPSFVLDLAETTTPVLHPLVEELLADERLDAFADALPAPEARPEPIVLDRSASTGLDALSEQLALAGYERVDRVQERGQFAVRGGLVDVFPTTGRDPLRVELFGDDVEAIRAFSPFTQRALHDVHRPVVY